MGADAGRPGGADRRTRHLGRPDGPRERVRLETADGVTLEGELRLPGRQPIAAVAFAHPHPRHGGTMASILVPRSARALQAAGYAVVRWNFRGVGNSDGEHGDGDAERQDVRAAVACLAGRGLDRIVLAGWSFGADMSLRVAPTEARVVGVVAVAPVLWYLDEADWRRLVAWGRPVRLLLADHDRYRPKEQARELAARLPDVADTVVAGSEHLFARRVDQAVAAVVAFVREIAPDAPASPSGRP